MKNIVLAVLLLVCVNSFAQSNGLYYGVNQSASSHSWNRGSRYNLKREVTRVIEGRLAFKNSAQGDFIQENPSYKYVVFDRSNPDYWTIELCASDYADPLDPRGSMSVYRIIPQTIHYLEDGFESRIVRDSPHGPQWTSLRVVEDRDRVVYIIGDSHDRWDGKIIMKWICKKGRYTDPRRR